MIPKVLRPIWNRNAALSRSIAAKRRETRGVVLELPRFAVAVRKKFVPEI